MTIFSAVLIKHNLFWPGCTDGSPAGPAQDVAGQQELAHPHQALRDLRRSSQGVIKSFSAFLGGGGRLRLISPFYFLDYKENISIYKRGKSLLIPAV